MNLPALDPLLHQPLRTQIAAFLSGRGESTFSELKRTLNATDGNLDAHLGKLIEAGYVESRRESGVGERSRTVYALTESGRTALSTYVSRLSEIVALSGAIPIVQTSLKGKS
ncbi:MAG: helix-turn-helix domain-containing protein [Burkholderiales bacterium]|nr:helix-turn-helix domain-containing protein [Burkholderiales bacterium]